MTTFETSPACGATKSDSELLPGLVIQSSLSASLHRTGLANSPPKLTRPSRPMSELAWPVGAPYSREHQPPPAGKHTLRSLRLLPSESMRFLAVSDIQAQPSRVLSVVDELSPEAVLMAGDLVDRGFYDGANWRQLRHALEDLERRRIPTYIVRGNKDIPPYFEGALPAPSRYIHSLDFPAQLLGGLSIRGVSYSLTESLERVRSFETLPRTQTDILVAHTPSQRRPWLFLLSCRVILTGHFDLHLAHINDTVFVSMWEFPGQYATIDITPDKLEVTLYQEGKPRSSLLKTRCGVQLEHPIAQSELYTRQIEALISMRRLVRRREIERIVAIQSLVALHVPLNHTREFLARLDDLPQGAA